MEIDIKHACSFTGHRPERLEMSEDKVIAWLEEQIRKAVSDGYTDFITGMQNGWEQEWVKRYRNLLVASDKTVYVSTKPGRTAFFERNHWMVDHSSRLIGVYTGAPGGTKETVWYAKNHGLEVITIKE